MIKNSKVGTVFYSEDILELKNIFEKVINKSKIRNEPKKNVIVY
ncbi:hypothetical protein [Thomasclavelia cocleata]|nr:hypothetical protein [Thomasclavelia cocleata]